ncbi:MAG: hypothetical protein ACXW0Z_20865 [Gemmatirosa sp.]
MRRIGRSIVRVAGLALLATAALAACGGAEREAPAVHDPRSATISAASSAAPTASETFDEGPPHRIFGCLTSDSAVYADIREDPETGDTVGVWITIWQAGDGIDGVSVSSSGNDVFTRPAPFARVQLAGVDSIALDLPHADGAADTTRLIARVSCERMWGRQRTHRDMPAGPALYRRVY